VWLGGGLIGALLLWPVLDGIVAAIILILTFGIWGGLIYYWLKQTPGMGEISSTNWFLIRGIPTTLVALGTGVPAAWASWAALENAIVTFVILIITFAVWGVMMFLFINNLPE
jgi:hypothetical protein